MLTCSSVCSAPGPLSRSPCELLPVGESHPVQALLRKFTALAGCASRSTATLPQEVHVINLRRGDITADARPDHAPLEVTLHLKPLQSLLVHHKPLVFVLSSPRPLVWRVQTEKLALGVDHTFHASQGSEVRFQPGNFSLGSRVLQGPLPHGNEHLLSWALKKYGGLTSFLELRMTRDIYVNVGEDPVFPDSCRIDNKFLSLNYLGAYVELQPSRGCVLSGPYQDPEVHIIELKAPNSSSAFQVDVIVELQPIAGLAPLHRDVTLILKCSKSVHWVIRSRDITGHLEVLSSDTIALSPSTERQMRVSKLPNQPLPSGTQALIKWAVHRGYRPVSVTDTAVANFFKLRLREPEVPDPMDSSFPPEFPIFHDMGVVGDADRHPVLPFFPPGAHPGGPFLPPPFHSHWEDGEPQEQQGVLSAGLEVRCEETRMVVSVDKESLQAIGVANADLTLQDPECKATVNATHYTLETPLSGCRTTVYPMPSGSTVLHINSVRTGSQPVGRGISRAPLIYIWGPPRGPRGPPYVNQGSPRGDIAFLQPFNCTYEGTRAFSNPGPGIVPGPGGGAGPEEEGVVLTMEVYDSVLFHSPDPQPAPTFSDGQQVFVEVLQSRADPERGFMIRSCFVSPDSSAGEPSEYRLVENLCPTDDSVHLYPQMEGRQRFSFTLTPQFNASLLFLHCDTSLCSKNPHGSPHLPTCIPASEGCVAVNLNIIMSMMRNSMTSTKALVVISDGGRPWDPTAALYFLDTPTVVCIAFAAFMIGALLTGALWFIYSNTGGGKAAPQQVVQKSQPVSENSSAAHSIGSTQSTPCSSSSTA
ncbi:unnamed protein product [Lota lota]